MTAVIRGKLFHPVPLDNIAGVLPRLEGTGSLNSRPTRRLPIIHRIYEYLPAPPPRARAQPQFQ